LRHCESGPRSISFSEAQRRYDNMVPDDEPEPDGQEADTEEEPGDDEEDTV
jgi:hypothetical protein